MINKKVLILCCDIIAPKMAELATRFSESIEILGGHFFVQQISRNSDQLHRNELIEPLVERCTSFNVTANRTLDRNNCISSGRSGWLGSRLRNAYTFGDAVHTSWLKPLLLALTLVKCSLPRSVSRWVPYE